MKKLLLIILLFIGGKSFGQYCDNSDVNKFIKHWIGKPYKLGGNSVAGIDCSNFVKKFYKEVCNLDIPKVCYQQWNITTRIVKSDLQIGDILFFNSSVSPSGWHCAIYIGNNKFVHAANKLQGVKINDLDEEYYKRHYKGAGRF